MVFKYSTAANIPVPILKSLEQRMYKALLRIPGERVRKRWLSSKSPTRAHVLEGVKEEDPFSGDIKISFRTLTIELPKGRDPLRD